MKIVLGKRRIIKDHFPFCLEKKGFLSNIHMELQCQGLVIMKLTTLHSKLIYEPLLLMEDDHFNISLPTQEIKNGISFKTDLKPWQSWIESKSKKSKNWEGLVNTTRSWFGEIDQVFWRRKDFMMNIDLNQIASFLWSNRILLFQKERTEWNILESQETCLLQMNIKLIMKALVKRLKEERYLENRVQCECSLEFKNQKLNDLNLKCSARTQLKRLMQKFHHQT